MDTSGQYFYGGRSRYRLSFLSNKNDAPLVPQSGFVVYMYEPEYSGLSTYYVCKRGLDGDNSYLKFPFNFRERKLYIF